MAGVQDRNGNNTRRWQRLPISFPLFARGTDTEGRPFKELATAFNVSAGGILVAVSRRLAIAGPLLLDIPAPPSSKTVRSHGIQHVEAEVVHVEQRERCKLLGLKFAHPIA